MLPAGSEGDVAGSSSEGDEHNRALTRELAGAYSPFGRRQFPRDSGCYDAALKGKYHHHQHVSPQGESDTSENTNFCDITNNLDSVVEQCNIEILARVRQAQKNVLNFKEDALYHPNIPNSSSNDKLQRKTKDSYVSVHGQTTLVDPCRRNLITRVSGRKTSVTSVEDSCEADQKLTTVKYVVGAANVDEPSNVATATGRGGCLSEKSSDSGVSSSSLSSANPKETRQGVLAQGANENPIHGAKHSTASNTAN